MNVAQRIRTLRSLHLSPKWRRVFDDPNDGAWCRKLDDQYESGNGEAVHAAWLREVEGDQTLAYMVLNVFHRHATDDVKEAARRAFVRREPTPDPTPCLFA